MNPAPQPHEAGRLALSQIDEVLARKPQKDDHLLTEATKSLCLYRDGLIAEGRAAVGDAGTARERLGRANAVLSIVAAVHFPVGPVPWDALAAARRALADLAGEDASSRPC